MIFAEFRDRYPQGSLVTDLLQVKDGEYIVRAAIAVDGTILATGLAAAASIEVAEDRARSRALAVLGIGITTPASPQPSQSVSNQSPTVSRPDNSHLGKLISGTSTQPPLATAPPVKASATEVSQPSELAANSKETFAETGEQFSEDSPHFFEIDEPDAGSNVDDELDAPPELTPTQSSIPSLDDSLNRSAVSSSRASRLKPTPQPQPATPPTSEASPPSGRDSAKPVEPDTEAPIDFSDAIAKTSVELKRLNWSEEQGRQYLWETFGKRSRQRLNDDELLAFLHHLETLPSSATLRPS